MFKITLFGYPNVGKSSLFNRLIGQKDAIISETSGTTRDVKRQIIEVNGVKIQITDTGGVDSAGEIFEQVSKASINEARLSDLVLFMVDGKNYPSLEEKRLFLSVAKQAKVCALVVNKIDNSKQKQELHEFLTLGIRPIFNISCSHNLGIEDLEDWCYALAKAKKPDEFESINLENENEIKVAIIGKPNVGKSSILNALTKTNRSVVSAISGTTIDPVDESIDYKNAKIKFVDTAGIRRRSKVLGLERLALLRTKKILKEAHIALLILDSSDEFGQLDETIAGLASDMGLGLIIVANKLDLSEFSANEIEKQIRHKFKFLEYAPIITTSAATKKRTAKILDLILKVQESYAYRIPTARLNELIQNALKRHALPSYKTKKVKIFYATQFDVMPPRISLVCNYPNGVHFSFVRYLKNQIREHFEFLGTPIVLVLKNKNERLEDD